MVAVDEEEFLGGEVLYDWVESEAVLVVVFGQESFAKHRVVRLEMHSGFRKG